MDSMYRDMQLRFFEVKTLFNNAFNILVFDIKICL